MISKSVFCKGGTLEDVLSDAADPLPDVADPYQILQTAYPLTLDLGSHST